MSLLIFTPLHFEKHCTKGLGEKQKGVHRLLSTIVTEVNTNEWIFSVKMCVE